MLILSRKKDESIIIGDKIEIMVIEVDGGQVKLGIEAPREVEILRSELYREVRDANKSSAYRGENLQILRNLFKKY